MLSRIIAVNTLLLAALWPAWDWWFSRGSGTLHTTLICLIALACVAARERPRLPSLWLPALLMVFFAGSCLLKLPKLVSALFAVAAVAAMLSSTFLGRAISLPFAGLLWLSMPMSSSLDFFLGFPMRLLSGYVAELLLTPWNVQLIGTALVLGDRAVAVDAPCSGVQMLWHAMFFVCVIGSLLNLRVRQFLLLCAGGTLAVVLSNGVRAAILFFTESHLVRAPVWTHDAAGILSFIFAMGLLYLITEKMRADCPLSVPRRVTTSLQNTPSPVCFSLMCGLCFLSPFLTAPLNEVREAPVSAFAGWPAEFEDEPLSPLPLTDRELTFARDFPGQVGRFQKGDAEVILRWCNAPTRLLHPASECLRAAGYKITPLPQKWDERQRLWSQFEARAFGRPSLLVQELIFDEKGQSWPDAPAWFWAAFLKSSRGPWWSVTISRPLK